MKKAFLIIFLLLPVSAFSDVLQGLKKTPATKYDIGLLTLEIIAYVSTVEIKKLGADLVPEFKFQSFEVNEANMSLEFKASWHGPAKELTNDICKALHTMAAQLFVSANLIEEAYPGLTKVQYEELSRTVYPVTELIANENESFKISCK